MDDEKDPADSILRGLFFSYFQFRLPNPARRPLQTIFALVGGDETLAIREINHSHASIRTARSTTAPMRRSPR